MGTDIVNNLAKNQASLNNQQGNTKETKEHIKKNHATSSPPSSLLGGQTTITKKETKGVENKTKVDKITKDSKIQDSKRDNVKGIPSGTSVTVKSVKSPFLPNSLSPEHFKKNHTTSSPSSNTTNSLSSSGSSNNSTSTLSFSNSFKSKNGSTQSMLDFVQSKS